MKRIKIIDDKVLREFCDRKKPGRLDLIVDVYTKACYAIYKNFEHKDVAYFAGKNYEKLIPVQLRFHSNNERENDRENHSKGKNYGVLSEILYAASSFEKEYGITHSIHDVELARKIVWDLITKSGLQTAVKQEKIFCEYISKKNR